MNRILDWLDEFSGYDKRGLGVFLLMATIPFLLAGALILTPIFSSEPAGFTDAAGREIVFPTMTPAEQQNMVDEIVREVLRGN